VAAPIDSPFVKAAASAAGFHEVGVARAAPLDPAPLGPIFGEELARAVGVEGNRLRLYPHRHGTDGFFMAAFTRKA